MNQKKGGISKERERETGKRSRRGCGTICTMDPVKICSVSLSLTLLPLSLLSGGPGVCGRGGSGGGGWKGAWCGRGGGEDSRGREREQGHHLAGRDATTHGTWEPGTAGLPFRRVDRSARQGTNHRGRPALERAGGALFHQEAPPEWMRLGGRKGATVPRLDARRQALKSVAAGPRGPRGACQGSSQGRPVLMEGRG